MIACAVCFLDLPGMEGMEIQCGCEPSEKQPHHEWCHAEFIADYEADHINKAVAEQ